MIDSPISTFRVGFFCFFIVIFGVAQGQELDVPKAYDAGVKAMDSGKYDEGLQAVDKVIAEHGLAGKGAYGSVFGHFYYLKGMLHIKKKEYVKAAENFKICYEKFPNEGSDLPNCFLAESLAQWGGCLMALKDFNGATAKYQQALALDEKYEPKLNRFEAQINLSKAMMLSGQSTKGRAFITKQMGNKEMPDGMKRSLFLILMGDWSPTAQFADVQSSVEQYRELMDGDTLVNRYRKQNPVYNSLASTAIRMKDPDRALYWYDRMISPVEVGKAYAGQIAKLKKQVEEAKGNPRAADFIKSTNATIAKLEEEMRNQSKQLSEILMGRASAYYAKGDLQAARKSYLELASRYPKHPDRAVILHNLAMCAVNLTDLDEATKYGMQYFREFPEHELRPAMAQVLVDVIFVQGKYADARRVATKLRESFSIGAPAADVPDFIASASLTHLNRHDEAETELADYLKNYPSGKRREAATYYMGLTKVNLQKWDEATALLDQFLETYKKSEMRAGALYFSGVSHMIAQDYPIANSRLIELQARHPDAAEIPNSYNILGDILSAREKPYAEIVASYKKALDIVDSGKGGDKEVAGYALRQMIIEANAVQQWDVAVANYDKFTSKYSDSAWRTDVLIAAVEPLVAKDRKAEAKQLLTDFVNEYAGKPNSTELDQMFGTYAEFLRENYSFAEVQEGLRAFPAKTNPPTPALQAWLYMAEIEAMDAEDAKKYKGDIGKTFGKLNELYQKNGNNLSNYTLVKLARYNSANGGNESQAREVYEYILKERPTGEALGIALVDLAKLNASKEDQTKQRSAVDLFNRVLNEVDDVSTHEDAVAGIARIESAAGNYEEAKKWWEQYRGNRDWRSYRAEAGYQYGVCLRQLGKRDEAAAIFVNVYSNFPSNLDWSTKAYIDTAKIIKSKGEELDALKLLRSMIQRMGHLKHPGVDEGRKLFYAWKEEYVAKQKK